MFNIIPFFELREMPGFIFQQNIQKSPSLFEYFQ